MLPVPVTALNLIVCAGCLIIAMLIHPVITIHTIIITHVVQTVVTTIQIITVIHNLRRGHIPHHQVLHQVEELHLVEAAVVAVSADPAGTNWDGSYKEET